MVPILAVFALGTVGNAVHPTLLKDHPLLLVALEPRNRFLLLVAEKVSFWPFLVVATVRRLISDPLFYLVGYLYGERGVRWIGRRFFGGNDDITAVVQRGFAKAAPVLVFLFPGAIVCALAGATGMSPVAFFLINVAGTVTVVTVVYHFAEFLDGPLGAVNRFYADNAGVLTVVSVVLIAFWVWHQYRQGRSELQSVSSIEEELTEEETSSSEPPDSAAATAPEAPPPAAEEEEQGEGRSGPAGRPEHD